MAFNLFELFATIGLKTEQFEKGIEKAKNKFQDLQVTTAEAEKGIGKFALGLGAALTGAAVLAGKAGIEYESAFAGVRKTVDATEEELKQFSDGIRNMAKEIPASASGIAEIAEAAGQLGIKNENLLSFTRTMADLGVATNMTSTQAANDLARLANITQMPQENFDRLGSSIVGLGNNLATTESEITSMALRLAGAGKQIGLSEAEIVGFAGALSSVGIEAEMGGSAFSKLMLNIDMAAAQGKEMLTEFAKVAGMTTGEFKTAFEQDASGAIITFLEGLGKVKENGGNAALVLDELGMSEIRLRDTLLRASGAGSVFADSIALSTEEWEKNTALTNEAEERYATMESKLILLKNAITDIGISLYESFQKPLSITIAALTNTLNFLGKNLNLILAVVVPLTTAFISLGVALNLYKTIDATSKGISILTVGLAELPKAIPKIKDSFETLILQGMYLSDAFNVLSSKTIPIFNTALAGASKAMAALNTAIAANPIGITIIAIAALTAGIIYLWNTNEDFKNALISAWETIRNTGEIVFDWLSKFFTEDLPNAFNFALDFFKNNWQQILIFITNPIAGIIAFLYKLNPQFKEWVDSFIQNVKNLIPKIIDTIINFFEDLPYKIGYAIGFTVATIIKWVNNIIETVKTEVPKIINTILSFFKNLPENIYNAIITTKDKLNKWITELVKTVNENMKKVTTAILNFFNNLPQQIYNYIIKTKDKIVEWAKGLIETAKTEIPKFIEKIIEFIKDLPEKFKEIGINMIKGLWEGIKDKGAEFKDNIKEFFKGITDSVKDVLGIHSPSRVFAEMGKNVDEGFINGILGMANKVDKAIDNVFGGLGGDIDYGINFSSNAIRQTLQGTSLGTTSNVNSNPTFILNVRADEVDEVQKIIKLFENYSQTQTAVGGVL